MCEPWQHQEHYQATTQEYLRFFHCVSSSPRENRVSLPETVQRCLNGPSPPLLSASTAAHAAGASLAPNQRRTLSVSRPRMPWGRKIITRMTMMPQTSQRQSARNCKAVDKYVIIKAPSSGP